MWLTPALLLPVHRAPPGPLGAAGREELSAACWGREHRAGRALWCSGSQCLLLVLLQAQAFPSAPEFLTCPAGRGEAVTSTSVWCCPSLGCWDLAAEAAFSRSSRSGWLGGMAGMLLQLCREGGLTQRGACAAPRGTDPLDPT